MFSSSWFLPELLGSSSSRFPIFA